MRLRLVLTLVFSSAVAGCIPYRYTDSPGLTGLVISSANGAPISGAEVVVEVTQGSELIVSTTLSTGESGKFSFEPKTMWGVFAAGMNQGPKGIGKITVSAAGFNSQARELTWWLSGPSVLKFETISLAPLSETPNTSLERTREG